MSGAELSDFDVHTVTVKPYRGVSGRGIVLTDSPVTVPGLLNRKLRFVRNSDGEQVASASSFSCQPQYADAFPGKSEVTLPDGTETTVITRAVSEGGDFIDGIDRVRVYLQ